MNNIAIDGPAGAGKSTIAKLLAKKLGYVYVDTGAMYRAIALYLIKQGIDGSDAETVEKAVDDVEISIKYIDGVQNVMLFDENVSGLIRTEEVSAMASRSSAIAKVRKKLVALQQEMAKHTAVVMDGRDIGTKVLPDAPLKIYLTASTAVRAKRRYDEMIAKGISCDLVEIEKDIIERDHNDMTRKESPLVQAEDAVLIDSSYMTIEEVADRIIEIAGERF